MPELSGWYVYADFCSGRVWAANTSDNSTPVVLIGHVTKTGDIAENTGFAGFRNPDLWRKLYSTGEECLGRACRNRRNC